MRKFILCVAAVVSAALAFADYRALIYSGGSPVSQNKVQNITSITAANSVLTETTVDSTKNYKLTTIDSMVFVSDTVFVTYNGESVSVVNPLQNLGVNVVTNGAYVAVTTDESLFDMKDVVFVLSGSSSNGFFYMTQQKRVSVVLDNLNLASANGSALAMIGDKGVSMELKGVNTLTDASMRLDVDTARTAALFINDKLDVTGSGSLAVVGTYKNGIYVKDDLSMNGGSITVTSQKSGVRVKDNLVINGGSLAVLSSNKGDGVDVNDTIYVNGGTLTSAVSAVDSKAVTCDGGYFQSAGTVNVSVTGDGSKGIKVGTALIGTDSVASNILITGGTCSVTLTGVEKYEVGEESTSGAGLKSDGIINITGGNVTVIADEDCSAVKGISADGAIFAHGTSLVTVDMQCGSGKTWCFKSDDAIYINPSCVKASVNSSNKKVISGDGGIYSPSATAVSD